MADRYDGFLYLWESRLLWATEESEHEPHAHLSTAIFLSLDGPFELQVGERSYSDVEAVVVRGNVLRSLRAPHPNLQFNIEPDMPDHAPLRAALGDADAVKIPASTYEHLRPRLREALARPLACTEAYRLFDDVLEAVTAAHQQDAPPLDPRVAAVTRRLREELPERAEVSKLAADLDVSASWLMHLFKKELGLPIRQYLRYLKIRKAACLVAAGWPLAEMSVAAGFSDQAHATRTVQRTYGLTPSHFSGSTYIRTCDAELRRRWGIDEFAPNGGA